MTSHTWGDLSKPLTVWHSKLYYQKPSKDSPDEDEWDQLVGNVCLLVARGEFIHEVAAGKDLPFPLLVVATRHGVVEPGLQGSRSALRMVAREPCRSIVYLRTTCKELKSIPFAYVASGDSSQDKFAKTVCYPMRP